MELKERIKKVLLEHPEGLTISEICKKTNDRYGSVWRCLKNDSEFFGDVGYWYVKTEDNKHFESAAERKFYKKFQNYDNAKVFDLEYFNSLSDWNYCSSKSGIKSMEYKTKNGNTIECDSQLEIKMLEYLEENNFVQAIGGQSFAIEYSTPYTDSRLYYPDIVALTNKGYIAIIEVKPATAMSYNINILKYLTLAEECHKKGYICTMIDPDREFITIDELHDMPVNEDLIELFEEIRKLKDCPIYEKEDVDEWWEDLKDCYDTKKEFELEVHSLIIYYEMYNKYKNGFYFSNESFK